MNSYLPLLTVEELADSQIRLHFETRNRKIAAFLYKQELQIHDINKKIEQWELGLELRIAEIQKRWNLT